MSISIQKLDYNAYSIDNKYREFTIDKKNGNPRKILAPIPSLKAIQKKIAKELQENYTVKKHVHSYVKGKGIRTNATPHKKQRFVINLDLSDFFQSINFGRVRGMFKSHPFSFNDEVSSILAQLCCHNNELPQGSPSSPIISNLITRKLDNQLKLFAKKNKSFYSRYSDDITFSTNLKKVPSKIGIEKDETFYLSETLLEIINSNGFKVNKSKTTLRKHFQNQYVTGLTVNKRVNVKKGFLKQVRAMLHSWEIRGLELATINHFKKNPKKKFSSRLFINIIEGKLLFISDIRGKEDLLFKSLLNKFNSLNPNHNFKNYTENYSKGKVKVLTEGNTDWMHLTAAINSLSVINDTYRHLSTKIEFIKYEATVGDTKLKSYLDGYISTSTKNTNPIIAIFDSDNIKALKNIVPKEGKRYKNFNNKVFTFYLPKPSHRKTNQNCIEHFYKDEDLTITDSFGRRIFLSDEFSNESGTLIKDPKITCYENTNKLKSKEIVITDKVRSQNEDSLALSKKDFAKYIYNKEERYKRVNFNSFKLIFDIIYSIISEIENENIQS
ncbi:reverse transcriptase domain-containing protein [Tenacibaculum sp. IB213877]|uniref:reverse transcriptase domain-containing protein n=1 Tax=Tenacibaculum sp. IB213877 TaxID=3097351 RepID=UPI002A59D9CE|nr:reverse transcriptase domain-containing protein [Tenacibaculum sp. IB213877]MDY0780162.1 reverse transcriptase domain-containing protein [Tenacibaculum sp. IB213877]